MCALSTSEGGRERDRTITIQRNRKSPLFLGRLFTPRTLVRRRHFVHNRVHSGRKLHLHMQNGAPQSELLFRSSRSNQLFVWYITLLPPHWHFGWAGCRREKAQKQKGNSSGTRKKDCGFQEQFFSQWALISWRSGCE